MLRDIFACFLPAGALRNWKAHYQALIRKSLTFILGEERQSWNLRGNGNPKAPAAGHLQEASAA
jgi:hypothetical protein